MKYKEFEIPQTINARALKDFLDRDIIVCVGGQNCANIKTCTDCILCHSNNQRKTLKEWVGTKEFLARLL